MIEVKNLKKNFGSFCVLDDLSLHAKKASVYGLVGPNGAGKTTLIKHLLGIYRQDAGEITINGQFAWDNPSALAKTIYIPDELYFFSQYTIQEMAAFYSELYPSWNWDRFERLKQVFPIDVKRRITRLSKGMQRQVAFWLGICVMPNIMILDEPVDGLDPVMRKKVWNLVLQDVAERETTVLISSHNLRELEDVCDHVGILYKGKIVAEKELDDMKSDIHKLQIAFSGELPDNFMQDIQILQKTQKGSVLMMIVKGDKEMILSHVHKANPLLVDLLPLTLEEIFIYELGGMGYEIQDVLI
ncbi:ABC transporter ATP-binding protein [Petroclostridium sp. X23]|uniref:ABC transporter ATP-binding protein n=1 Tax=Petroclostridium sp. X23 TaxID=3045146 RepID=UPI0024AE5F0E|nr:ABC transporter ATP-binding protein [Petroclostridium sp. X23]WHH58868.1 ABC transporter ATP-binding protein [Petroclostridium sp. X23]